MTRQKSSAISFAERNDSFGEKITVKALQIIWAVMSCKLHDKADRAGRIPNALTFLRDDDHKVGAIRSRKVLKYLPELIGGVPKATSNRIGKSTLRAKDSEMGESCHPRRLL